MALFDLPFDYLICIDFEATCDEISQLHKELLVTRDQQEIIEFPWVVLDTKTLEIVESEQNYIIPENTPVTEFCTQLTGITLEKLQAEGVTFHQAVDRFAKFVDTKFIERGKTFCIVAHGKWDLAQLRYEAGRKGYELLPWMHRFIDLREVYRFWGERDSRRRVGSTSLQSMCDALRIQLSGQLHSGIDDATTVANVLARFIREARMVSSLPSAEDAVAATFPAPYSWLESMAALLEASDDAKWLEVSGLSYDASDEEICAWISQCLICANQADDVDDVDGTVALEKGSLNDAEACAAQVQLEEEGTTTETKTETKTETNGFKYVARCILDPNRMRPKGTGYIKCKSREDVIKLFGCSPPPMRQRSIVMTTATEEDIQSSTTRRFKPSSEQYRDIKGTMLMMENMPFHVGRLEVLEYIGITTRGAEPIDLKSCCSKNSGPNHRSTGVGFVEMKTHEDAVAFLLGSTDQLLQGRPLKVTRVRLEKVKNIEISVFCSPPSPY